MGRRNYLIEGVSGAGKTSVCRALQRRGYVAINGDTELAYQGDPETGARTDGFAHQNHIWDVERVRSLIADTTAPVAFFCGGSRNHSRYLHLFDAVFVLDLDAPTLRQRLELRPADEYGGTPEQREHVLRLHHTREDLPRNAISIDAAQPLDDVLEAILRHVGQAG